MSTPTAGYGTQFYRYNAGTMAWDAIANITGIGGPSASKETIDVTTLTSTGGYREFIGSLRDGGEISLSMNFIADTYALMKTDFDSDGVKKYRIVLPDSVNSTFEFEGLVTGIPIDIVVDDKITAEVTIKVSGPTSLNSVDIIVGLATLSDLTGSAGAALSTLGLAATVTATYDDNTTEALAIKWDAGTPMYAGTAGVYNFSGTLTLPATTINPKGFKASQKVTIS